MGFDVLFAILGSAIAILSLPGTIQILFLTMASIFFTEKRVSPLPSGISLAVLVPAHNEVENIAQCLRSLLACNLGAHKVTLVVIADNCEDETAALARQEGARVLERHDPDHRGKGRALYFAFETLMKEDFDAYVVVDADTVVEDNFIAEFAGHFQSGSDAVQCRNLQVDYEGSNLSRVASLAFQAFNVVRPRGRNRLGFSAGIFGTGFGLSKRVLAEIPFLAESIAEDLEYHIHLVLHKKKVDFLDRTTIRSASPSDEKASKIQRSRWEGGRFLTMGRYIPKLMGRVLRGELHLLGPLMDLLTLPLTYHVLLVLVAGAMPFAPLRLYAVFALGVLLFHVLITIVTVGSRRDFLTLLMAPFYVLWKLSRISSILNASRKGAAWIRTPRR